MNSAEKEEKISKIKKAIDSIRPYLISDGGDVEIIEITDDLTVKVKLVGACQGCPFSVQTLKMGIEQAVRKEVPEIKELVEVQ